MDIRKLLKTQITMLGLCVGCYFSALFWGISQTNAKSLTVFASGLAFAYVCFGRPRIMIKQSFAEAFVIAFAIFVIFLSAIPSMSNAQMIIGVISGGTLISYVIHNVVRLPLVSVSSSFLFVGIVLYVVFYYWRL